MGTYKKRGASTCTHNICFYYGEKTKILKLSQNHHQMLHKSSESIIIIKNILTLLLLNTTCPVLTNSGDPDQLASEEANQSGSALFIQYVNFYQKPGSSNLIGWKLEVGLAS